MIRLMKLNHFYGSISIKERDGYTENLQFGTNRDNNNLEFNYPYGNITPEEVAAVSEFTKIVTDAYNKLQATIDGVNADLKLEQYAPKSTGSDLDIDAEVSAESAVPQLARGGGEQELAEQED